MIKVTNNEKIAQKIGDELQELGGYLQCMECGNKKPLGNVGEKLKNGWPKCCGYTMRWITDREAKGDE